MSISFVAFSEIQLILDELIARSTSKNIYWNSSLRTLNCVTPSLARGCVAVGARPPRRPGVRWDVAGATQPLAKVGVAIEPPCKATATSHRTPSPAFIGLVAPCCSDQQSTFGFVRCRPAKPHSCPTEHRTTVRLGP